MHNAYEVRRQNTHCHAFRKIQLDCESIGRSLEYRNILTGPEHDRKGSQHIFNAIDYNRHLITGSDLNRHK